MKAATTRLPKLGPKKSLDCKHSMPDSVARTAQPSKKMLFRASHPIMVLAFRDNHHAAVTVSPGDVLEVIGPAEDDRFVIVSIKGEEFLAFESDISKGGEFLSTGLVQSP